MSDEPAEEIIICRPNVLLLDREEAKVIYEFLERTYISGDGPINKVLNKIWNFIK